MATVNLTSYFANLNGWQGDLLNAGGGDASWDGHGTVMTVTLGDSSPFTGYVIKITGTDFNYVDKIPVEGDMSGLTVTDTDGNLVLAVSGLAPNSLASDFSLFWSNAFGWSSASNSFGAQPVNTWSMLLSGNDTFFGYDGSDTNYFPGQGAGNDVYNMGAGDDHVFGSAGNDTINGGDGFDMLGFNLTTYTEGLAITQGLTVRVGLGTVVDCWGYTDHVSGIEYFIGSTANDRFFGGAADDYFDGMRGKDVFFGGGGSDWVRYEEDAWEGGQFGITADLRTGIGGAGAPGHVIDGFGNRDQVTSIENVGGTRYDDIFIGNRAQNTFAGAEGKDSYSGGAGSDWIVFDWKLTDDVQSGITVDLTRTSGRIQNDGFGNVEETSSIENIRGSALNDVIKGSGGQNWIVGKDGQDRMTGAGGADYFRFEQLSEMGDGDIITDFHAGAGPNQDHLQFFMSNLGASTTLHLVNGPHATEAVGTFVFRSYNHTLYWDDDGTGSDAMLAVCVLRNVVSLSADNFDLV